VAFLTREDTPPWPEIVEDGDTYRQNALIKAKALVELTGKAAIADDSGIEIDALEGAPGVRSARFAGPRATDEDNNRKMADLLDGVPPERRTARYRCVTVLLLPDGTKIEGEGTCEGRIALAPRGTNGFGYDPWFIPTEQERELTFGELPLEFKHGISHRGKALRQLADRLEGSGILGGSAPPPAGQAGGVRARGLEPPRAKPTGS
jgi:non-canonical purine NTP pyrophosphatase (RdgB/HAM1 family)